jgi:CDGSH-type Zn-finger protein
MSKAEIARKAPYNVNLVAGRRYAWCTCGLSAKQPFCDGAHKVGEMRPIKFTAQEDGEAWLCGCKQTGNPPYCDGTHNTL